MMISEIKFIHKLDSKQRLLIKEKYYIQRIDRKNVRLTLNKINFHTNPVCFC